MHVIVRLCIEKMDTPICAKQARRRFLPRRERRGLRAAIMVNWCLSLSQCCSILKLLCLYGVSYQH
jgi:hypothetical protein